MLVLLGIWGALIPFVGPYFHYAYTPDRAWAVTSGRMWLEVLPGIVALVGGVVVLMSRFRPAAVLGAWLAAVAGAWFAVGSLIAGRWASLPAAGTPVGGRAIAVLEQLGFFTGLGVVIVFVSAAALGRRTVVAARDTAVASSASDVAAVPDKAPARASAKVPAGAVPAVAVPAPARPRAPMSRVLPRRVITKRSPAESDAAHANAAADSESGETADQATASAGGSAR